MPRTSFSNEFDGSEENSFSGIVWVSFKIDFFEKQKEKMELKSFFLN